MPHSRYVFPATSMLPPSITTGRLATASGNTIAERPIAKTNAFMASPLHANANERPFGAGPFVFNADRRKMLCRIYLSAG